MWEEASRVVRTEGEKEKWQISTNYDGNYHVKMVIVMREHQDRGDEGKEQCKEAVSD